jgi:hypothetical protein
MYEYTTLDFCYNVIIVTVMNTWTEDDIANWLKEIGLSQYTVSVVSLLKI